MIDSIPPSLPACVHDRHTHDHITLHNAGHAKEAHFGVVTNAQCAAIIC